MERTSKTFDLSGKVAVVTGAARGIGRAAATALGATAPILRESTLPVPFVRPWTTRPRAGKTLRRQDARSKLSAGAAGQRDFGGLCDAASPIEREFGRIDILFANAGIQAFKDRYAQAIVVGGGEPTGNERKDERTALAGLANKSPLGIAMIQPEDVAPMVVFLASDEVRMASGGTYAITAGDSANAQS